MACSYLSRSVVDFDDVADQYGPHAVEEFVTDRREAIDVYERTVEHRPTAAFRPERGQRRRTQALFSYYDSDSSPGPVRTFRLALLLAVPSGA